MIISLCERCSEGCSHCFINSLPRSPVMSEETLTQTLNFLEWMNLPAILISGGEFSEHPHYFDYVSRLFDSNRALLLSNGSWFYDDNKQYWIKRLLNHKNCMGMQIRTHPKYYPSYKTRWGDKGFIEAFHPGIDMYDDGIKLEPLGRARANHKNDPIGDRILPMCGNMYMLNRQNLTFKETIHHLSTKGQFCSPYVASTGNIHAGETPYCTVLGSISDSNEVLTENIKIREPMNKCGRRPKLDKMLEVFNSIKR